MPSTVGNKEFWEVDGVSMAEHGWNVATVEGRFNVPQLRGEDTTFSYVEGDDFRPKVPASRVMTLKMWMMGVNPSTGDHEGDLLVRWNDNWKFLTNLFWTPHRQVRLTRRLWVTDPVTGQPGVQTTYAYGQYMGGLEPSMTGRYRATFEVQFKLADPFFYPENDTVVTIERGQTVDITNYGDYVAAHRHMYITFNGFLKNPLLTNTTPNPDVTVAYVGNLFANQKVDLDVRLFLAKANFPEQINYSLATFNRVSYIRHSGTRYWFGLQRGNNSVKLTADDGTGNAVIRFRPPYM